MTKTMTEITIISVTVIFFFCSTTTFVNGLGSASTIAVSYGSQTVCGIVAEDRNQRIECYRGGQRVAIQPSFSYSSISGGRDFFCGLTSDGFSFFCWDWKNGSSNQNPSIKRVYNNQTVRLRDLTVGDYQVCAVQNETGDSRCWWRGVRAARVNAINRYLSVNDSFRSISSGRGFSCGILMSNRTVRCWGIRNSIARDIETQFANVSMFSLVAGDSHVCGVNFTGYLDCRGNNDSGQLNVPNASTPFEYSGLALGVNHSCAIRMLNESIGSVVCWGDSSYSTNVVDGISFESLAVGLNFTCGLTTRNLSVICWGPGWPSNGNSSSLDLPLPKIIPGSCTQTSCSCGIYINSLSLCSGSGNICKPCVTEIQPSPPPLPLSPPPPPPPPPPPVTPSSPTRKRKNNRGLLVFAIVGSFGIFAGLCTVVYCIWTGVCCCNHKKVHNSVQPTINRNNSNNAPVGSGLFSPQYSRSSTIRRQSSRVMRRLRSGTSSKHTDRAEEFTLAELAAATNNFSWVNKIGAGSFGTVYKGKLPDGREVAIKRGGDTGLQTKKFQEKESAFQSELAFLSRLHHKHLVGLVGFCDEKDERLLVYEYMKNGSLYDHLHSKNNVDETSSVVNSWKRRIKIALDAARGIEYLHSYAVPPIIHRDIKSSNILLDSNFIARVSDFGLSLLSPELDGEQMLAKVAGTVGYMDPEYYGLNVLTAKSDVYGLGVVLLELLTGKKALFKNEEEGGSGSPVSVVDFAEQRIMTGELTQVLDPRVGPPEMKEAEAVELMAYTAIHCVNMEGKERPCMTDIVINLERALALCDDSHGSISSASFSIIFE